MQETGKAWGEQATLVHASERGNEMVHVLPARDSCFQYAETLTCSAYVPGAVSPNGLPPSLRICSTVALSEGEREGGHSS